MKRLECLDGLRGVLAMYVVLGHAAPFAMLPDWLQSAVGHGGAAVDMFFILSGLVISQSLDRVQGHRRRFLLARVLRIYPVFLPVFALAVAVQPLSCGFGAMPWIGADSAARDICSDHWQQPWPAEISAHLLMIHGLFPRWLLPDVWVSFLGAAWSLSTEWQFYVLAMLAWRPGTAHEGTAEGTAHEGMTRNPTPQHGQRTIMLLLLLAAAGLAWQAWSPTAWTFSRAFLPNKAHFFALGVASLAVVRQGRRGLPGYATVLAATLTVCAAQGQGGKLLPPLVWSACLAAQCLPAAPLTHSGLSLVRRALQGRVALWFGAISYPVYLANEPIQKILSPALGSIAAGDAILFSLLWLPAAIGLPVLAASWLHRHIELPAMRRGRHRFDPGRDSAGQPARPAIAAPAGADARASVQRVMRGL